MLVLPIPMSSPSRLVIPVGDFPCLGSKLTRPIQRHYAHNGAVARYLHSLNCIMSEFTPLVHPDQEEAETPTT